MDYVSHETAKRLSFLLEGLEEVAGVAGEKTVWALTQETLTEWNSFKAG